MRQVEETRTTSTPYHLNQSDTLHKDKSPMRTQHTGQTHIDPYMHAAQQRNQHAQNITTTVPSKGRYNSSRMTILNM